MSMLLHEGGLPTRSDYIAWQEFLELTGLAEPRLRELLEMGWLDARRTGKNTWLFRGPDIYRVRKLERICCDFDLPLVGGTIIVDLLERIERLQLDVRKLRTLSDQQR